MAYPDDMARFNDDPRSPLYSEPEQEVTQEQINEFFESDDIVETMVESESVVESLHELLMCSKDTNLETLGRFAKRLILASEQYAKEFIEND